MSGQPRVFISYCHADQKDQLWRYRIGEELVRSGIAVWDDTRIRGGQSWRQEIANAIAGAHAAVLLLSKDYLNSEFVNRDELPQLLERRDRGAFPIIPVEISPCDWSVIPWLSELQILRIPAGDGRLTDAVLESIMRDITGTLRQPAVERAPRAPDRAPEKISLSRLPFTGPSLFGRAAEMESLNQAWEGRSARIVQVIGLGGVGKTALVNGWLAGMSKRGFSGAELVYAWSFRNLDREQQPCSDAFLAAALEWFGDPDPAKGATYDKGERLAQLVKKRRTLLVLDSVEPLLQAPEESGGRLKDDGLQALLGELAWFNPGLCVLTSRLPVAGFEEPAAVQIPIASLSPADGANCLAQLGVQGTRAELEETSREFGGHPMALTLLGTYLVDACHGDVRQRTRIPSRHGADVQRIMEAYERWLEGKPDLGVLRVLGLFDRPAEIRAIQALCAGSPLEGVTAGLEALSEEELRVVAKRLRTARILDPENPAQPDVLDCHPLVREHFARKLRRDCPGACKEAHNRLYEYYKSLPGRELPETLEEMAPLFAAIPHGCAAGRHPEVWTDVYLRRTRRNGEFYSTQKLGAFGADLAALACFFESPWTRPVSTLAGSDRAVLLNETGESLRALGRLREAVAPLEEAATASCALEDWRTAAINRGNLSQLFVAIGDLHEAVRRGRESVELAERSGDPFQRMVRRCDLGNALYHQGLVQQAQAAFEYAERIQREVYHLLQAQNTATPSAHVLAEWDTPLLPAMRGYQYCGLLLGQGQFREVLRRAEGALEIARRTSRLLHIGLHHLLCGRAHLVRVAAEGLDDFAEAAYHLEQAVAGLRQCGRRDYLPCGLTARAGLHRLRHVFKDARRDLDEALSICVRDGMQLHQADCHLEYARLYIASDDAEAARQSFQAAGKLIEAAGYHWRDAELQQLAVALFGRSPWTVL
jgi:tetratricopeptide (TPR) repeat protein